MKNVCSPLLFFAILFCLTIVNSQTKKHCDDPAKVQLDLNNISKCTIEKNENSTNKRSVVLNIASKKIRKRIVRKRSKANAINANSENINSNTPIEIKNEIISTGLSSKEVLFSIVDEVPLFPECESIEKNQSDCFNNTFSKYFAKNFDPERASEDGISGKVFIQFTIDIKGNVKTLLIKTRKKNKMLENEIKRVLSKLPNFTPGKHKGIPVNVKYSLPINFNAE